MEWFRDVGFEGAGGNQSEVHKVGVRGARVLRNASISTVRDVPEVLLPQTLKPKP